MSVIKITGEKQMISYNKTKKKEKQSLLQKLHSQINVLP